MRPRTCVEETITQLRPERVKKRGSTIDSLIKMTIHYLQSSPINIVPVRYIHKFITTLSTAQIYVAYIDRVTDILKGTWKEVVES
jgi:hypothetical protein